MSGIRLQVICQPYDVFIHAIRYRDLQQRQITLDIGLNFPAQNLLICSLFSPNNLNELTSVSGWALHLWRPSLWQSAWTLWTSSYLECLPGFEMPLLSSSPEAWRLKVRLHLYDRQQSWYWKNPSVILKDKMLFISSQTTYYLLHMSFLGFPRWEYSKDVIQFYEMCWHVFDNLPGADIHENRRRGYVIGLKHFPSLSDKSWSFTGHHWGLHKRKNMSLDFCLNKNQTHITQRDPPSLSSSDSRSLSSSAADGCTEFSLSSSGSKSGWEACISPWADGSSMSGVWLLSGLPASTALCALDSDNPTNRCWREHFT